MSNSHPPQPWYKSMQGNLLPQVVLSVISILCSGAIVMRDQVNTTIPTTISALRADIASQRQIAEMRAEFQSKEINEIRAVMSRIQAQITELHGEIRSIANNNNSRQREK